MPVPVQGPDGNIYQFPDGTDKAAAIAYFKKKGIGVPKTNPASFLDRLTQVEKPDPAHPWNPREAAKAVGNIGAGGLSVLLHPIDTLANIGGVFTAPLEMAEGAKFSDTVPGQMVKSFKENPYGAVESGVGQAAVMGGAEGTAESIPETGGKVARFLTKTTPKETAELVKETRVANEAVVKAHADEAQDAVNKQRDMRLNSLKKIREEGAERQTKTEEVKAGNKQALKANRQSEEMPAKRQKVYRELQGQIETARETARKVGNEKYNAVNPVLDPIEADGESMESALDESMQKIKGSETEPPVLKSISKRINEGKAEPLTYRDLQGFYSELNSELSKGTLPGDVYAAYDEMHEAIGNEMQRIADEKGMGKQLTDARNYWRRMKQTFGKPYNPTDVATKTMEGSSSDIARAEEEANRRRLLASFDPSIQGTFEHLDNLERGSRSLGSPKPLREILKPNPEAPRVTVPRMQDAAVPERPTPKTINAEDVQNKKLTSLEKKGIPGIRKSGRHIVNYGIGLHALWDAFSGRLENLPRDFGLGAAGYGATEAFARLLERPDIQEMLTKPTPADLAQIPADLRGNLGPMLDAAKAKGIKVDPRLYALVAAPQRKRVAAALQP